MIRRLLIATMIVSTCIAWGALSVVYVYANKVRGTDGNI